MLRNLTNNPLILTTLTKVYVENELGQLGIQAINLLFTTKFLYEVSIANNVQVKCYKSPVHVTTMKMKWQQIRSRITNNQLTFHS